MNLTNKIRAGYPGIYIITHEEQRAEILLAHTAKEVGWTLFAWTITSGRFDVNLPTDVYQEDQLQVLDSIKELPEKTILVLKDYHMILADPNPFIYRKLKDALLLAKTQNKCIVILAPALRLPPELEKLFAVTDLPLPDGPQLAEVLKGICEGNGKKTPKGDALTDILGAARGLTSFEAEDAFSLSIVESGKPDGLVVAREKAETIRKNGILKIIKGNTTLKDIGGLDVAKAWLEKRRCAFSDEAKKYGLPTPKGFLAFGIQGTGKSLLAKAAAAALGNAPLLHLDAGAIFAGHVGESESNMRAVIVLAEAIAPCVLWIDELEKGFGKSGSGDTDGGTKDRVFASLLQWMNDKTAPVFIAATANEAHKLDPALVRKGRFDEIFFVDLPDDTERRAIWWIQITKYGRDPELFDLKDLVRLSAGWTGAEIEAAFCEALFVAFEHGREPTLLDIAEQVEDFVPLSKMMAEDVKRLREWAKGRARRASTVTETKGGRKLAA